MEVSLVGDENRADVLTYDQFVRGQAAGPKPSPRLVNRQPEHAAILVQLLFQEAREHVRIVSRGLDPAIYDTPPVIDAAINFLNGNATSTIELAVEDPVHLQNSRLIAALRQSASCGRLKLFSVPENIQRAYPFNFIVVDGKHYRFEQERSSLEAVAQFANPEVGAALEDIFAKVKASSSVIPV